MCKFDYLLKDEPFDLDLHCLNIEEQVYSESLMELGEADGPIRRQFLMNLKASVIKDKAKRRKELGWV
jgi:hypothetical protein